MKRSRSSRRAWPAMLIVAGMATLSGCAINARETDLQKAVKAHDVEAVRTLLAAGATLGHSFGEPAAPYELALLNLSPSDPATVEIVRLLIARMDEPAAGTAGARAAAERPANFIFASHRSKSSTAQDARSAVEIAARQWSAEGVKVLLEHGLDIKSVGVSDALVSAAGNGCVPAIRVLLDAGANLNLPDRKGDTALQMARRVKNGEAAAFLLGRGARGPKPPRQAGAARSKVQDAVGSILVPGGGVPEEDPGAVWLEGADVLQHAIGQAALKLGVPASALERASVALITSTTAELFVSTPPATGGGKASPPAATETASYKLALDNGTWVFRPES